MNRRLKLALLLSKEAQDRPTLPSLSNPINIEDDPEEIAGGPISQDSTPRLGKDGVKRYYNSFNQLHRRDGPAVISPDGNQLYFQWGKLHREDGPAAVFFNGTQKWYLDGEQVTPVEVLRLRISQGRMNGSDIDTLKELAEIAFLDYANTDVEALKQAGTLLMERGVINTRNMSSITEFLRAAMKF